LALEPAGRGARDARPARHGSKDWFLTQPGRMMSQGGSSMRHSWIAGALLVLAAEAAAQDTATFSFSQNHSGTYPRSISGDESIRVDLSGLPERAVIHRAVLRPGRVEGEAITHRDVAPKLLQEGQ